MSAPVLPSIYNPRGQGDEDSFVAGFVARHASLNMLLRRLHHADSDHLGAHHVLVGPRGMGKTSLLRRIAIAIGRDPELRARFIPLSFREEQYNVLSLGHFWRNCGESLAEWAEASGQAELAQDLDCALPTQSWASDEDAAEQFSAQMRALGRQAVLFVDNLDLILEALPAVSRWALRRRLQDRDGPILIGAATHPLKQSADREEAFYEFFQPVHLDPLDERETEHCMRALGERGGEHGAQVIRILNQQPERLRTLHVLTGGNPRVLALIYRLLGTGESEAAMTDLERLLDDVTPYYKGKVEEYQTAQQRAVIDAIALHWDPITTGDLARLTRVPTTTLSPLIIRLRRDGLIEDVELSGAYAGHQLVERFLNIWYLMRHGTRRTKQKMRWLVAFLTSFYTAGELTEIAGRATDRATWHPEHRFAFDAALKWRPGVDAMRGVAMARMDDQASPHTGPFDIPTGDGDPGSLEHEPQTTGSASDRVDDSPTSNLSPAYQAARAMVDEAVTLARAGDSAGAITRCDEVLARFADATELGLREQFARALLCKAFAMGDRATAMTLYDELLARFGDAPEPGLRERVAMALVNKAISLGQMGDLAAAITICDEVVARFAGAPEPGLREQVAMALVNKAASLAQLGDLAAGITIYDEIVARFGDASEPGLRQQVAMALVNKAASLAQLGDLAAGITIYDEVVARFAGAPEPGLREQVAMALVNKAASLAQLGDLAAGITIYDEVVARFAGAPEPGLREQVAMALVNKAISLAQLGDLAAGITMFDEVVARFADASEPGLREQVAKALVNKGASLAQFGDPAAGITICDETVARFGDAPEPGLREQVARALFNKGGSLAQLGDPAAEITICDEVVARFGDAPEQGLREQVAKALVNKAISLGQMGDLAAAITIYDEIVARFGDAPEPGLREPVARGLVNKAASLGETGDLAAEITICDEVVARFGDAPEPGLREQVARALVNKAARLAQLGDLAAGITICDEVVARLGDAPEPGLREQVARALFNKGGSLAQLGDLAAEITICDEVVARFGDAPEPGLREQVARALVNKAISLGQMGDLAAAITIYDEIVARFGDAPEPGLREQVARALVNKAASLCETGDLAAGITICDEVVARFGDALEPGLREQVAMALVNKAVNRGQTGDSAGELALYDEVLVRFADAPEPDLRKWAARALRLRAITLRQDGQRVLAIDAYEQLLSSASREQGVFSAMELAGARISLANLLLDFRGDLIRPEALYREAALAAPLSATANLAWFHLLAGRSSEARLARGELNDLPRVGLALLDAGIDMASDNFGAAMGHLATALDSDLDANGLSFGDDLERLLRLAHEKGYGERLLAWFEETGFADRLAPLYVAFKAFVRTRKLLLDVNPEVRRPARTIYDRLDAPRRYAAAGIGVAKKPKPPVRKKNASPPPRGL